MKADAIVQTWLKVKGVYDLPLVCMLTRECIINITYLKGGGPGVALLACGTDPGCVTRLDGENGSSCGQVVLGSDKLCGTSVCRCTDSLQEGGSTDEGGRVGDTAMIKIY